MSGFADLSYGRGEMLAGSAGVSGAVVPNKILFRLAGTYYKTDGLIRNTTRGDHADKVNHDWSLRGRLDFILSDSVKLDVRGQYGELNAKPQYWTIVGSGDANDFQLPFYAYPNRNFGKTSELTARFEADLGFATLTSISGYTRLTETQFADADFSPVQAVAVTQPFKNRLLSQEVRLVSPAGNAFRWLVSADYLNSKRAITTRVFVDTGDVANDPLNPALTIVSSAETSGRDAYGVSGQVDWDVLPGLTLTAGIRYDKDMRDQTNVATNIARSKSFEAWQPKLSASYKIDDRKLIYLTYGVGFRSGGFNPPNFATGIYNPEKLKNFEAGFKSQWFDKALTINGAVFTGIVTNYQFYYVDLATVSQVVGNIDRVRVTGAELEIRAIPAKGLNVFANFGMSDPTIKRLATFPQFVGNKTPRASKYSFSSGFDYTHQLSENLQAFLRVDAQMISKKYWYTDNLDVQNAKNFVNGSIGINFDRSTLSLWGKNIFGEKAYESYYPTNLTGFPADIGWPNMPASYGVQFRAKF